MSKNALGARSTRPSTAVWMREAAPTTRVKASAYPQPSATVPAVRLAYRMAPLARSGVMIQPPSAQSAIARHTASPTKAATMERQPSKPIWRR